MVEIITEKIIKPEQCVIAFGVPTSEQDFNQDLFSENKDFAKRFNDEKQKLLHGKEPWEIYHNQLIDPLYEIEPSMKKDGATVIHKLTIDKFGRLFNENSYDVIILFSHWKDNTVEFYDGMIEIPDIIAQVPVEFYGILDLIVCHPKPLRIAIDQYRPNCIVKSIDCRVTPYIWLYFYKILFNHLAQNNLTYIVALEELLYHYSRKREELYYEKISKYFQRIFGSNWCR